MISSQVTISDWTKASQYNNLRDDAMPTGGMIAYPVTTPPTGFLYCNGAAISRVTYSALFAVIGESYGAGDGVNTFNIPDVRDRIPLVKNAEAIGATGGGTHTIAEAELPSHRHLINYYTHSHILTINGAYTGAASAMPHSDACGTFGYTSSSAGSHNHGGATGAKGSGTAITIQASYTTKNYIIKI